MMLFNPDKVEDFVMEKQLLNKVCWNLSLNQYICHRDSFPNSLNGTTRISQNIRDHYEALHFAFQDQQQDCDQREISSRTPLSKINIYISFVIYEIDSYIFKLIRS